MEEYDDDIKVSKFNPAVLKMSRLDEINKLMNFVKLKPDAIHLEYQEYNFILWLRCINNLLYEANSKLTDKEKEKINNIKMKIEDWLSKYPVIENKKTLKGKTKSWNNERWKTFKKAFEFYEDMVKNLVDKHGLDTPLKDESALF